MSPGSPLGTSCVPDGFRSGLPPTTGPKPDECGPESKTLFHGRVGECPVGREPWA